jgi:5'-3' exonuclease
MAWFYAQILIGDTVDNITGLPNCGPVRAYDLLKDKSLEEMLSAVTNAYAEVYGDTWEAEMLEQGQLVWLIRKLNEDGSPVMYQIGMEE